MNANEVLHGVLSFGAEKHRLLSRAETSTSRLVLLDATLRRLPGLSSKQGALMREAVTCTQAGCYRSAHVMAWAAFIDFLHETLSADGFIAMSQSRPDWCVRTIEDLREHSDYQVIQTAYAIGWLRKTEMKALHGFLNRRNECAHPEDTVPDLNESLGYISQVLSRINDLKTRPLPKGGITP